MKIAHLYLKAYGAFSGRRLDFDNGDGANFHVIYGPNEAGKSTTLRALTGLLFGINVGVFVLGVAALGFVAVRTQPTARPKMAAAAA